MSNFGYGHGRHLHKYGVGSAKTPSDLTNYVLGYSAESFVLPGADHTQASAMVGNGNLAAGGPAITMNSNYPYIHQTTWTGLNLPGPVTQIDKPGEQNWLSNNWWSHPSGPYFQGMIGLVGAPAPARSSAWSGVIIFFDPAYTSGTSYRGVFDEAGWGGNWWDSLEATPNFFKVDNTGGNTNIQDDIAGYTNSAWQMMAWSYTSGDEGKFWYHGNELALDATPPAGTTGITRIVQFGSNDFHIGCIHLWASRNSDADMVSVQSTLAADYGLTI